MWVDKICDVKRVAIERDEWKKKFKDLEFAINRQGYIIFVTSDGFYISDKPVNQ